MVLTELPRATVESWLEDLQRDAKLVPKAEPKPSATAERKVGTKERSSDDDESIFSRAKSLKDEVVGDVVKAQLGLDRDEKKVEKKSIFTGAILGLLFPPLALGYAAPIVEGLLAGGAYLLVAIAMFYVAKLPVLGGIVQMPIMLTLHVLGALAGLAYAFRYNRTGARTPLLMRGKRKTEE